MEVEERETGERAQLWEEETAQLEVALLMK